MKIDEAKELTTFERLFIQKMETLEIAINGLIVSINGLKDEIRMDP